MEGRCESDSNPGPLRSWFSPVGTTLNQSNCKAKACSEQAWRDSNWELVILWVRYRYVRVEDCRFFSLILFLLLLFLFCFSFTLLALFAFCTIAEIYKENSCLPRTKWVISLTFKTDLSVWVEVSLFHHFVDFLVSHVFTQIRQHLKTTPCSKSGKFIIMHLNTEVGGVLSSCDEEVSHSWDPRSRRSTVVPKYDFILTKQPLSQMQNIYRMTPRLDMFTIFNQQNQLEISWNCASGQIQFLCALSSEVTTAAWLLSLNFKDGACFCYCSYVLRMSTPIFFLDSNSPCWDLLFPYSKKLRKNTCVRGHRP